MVSKSKKSGVQTSLKSRKVSVPLIKPKKNEEQQVEYEEMELIDLHSEIKFEKLAKIERETLIAEIILSYPELSMLLVEGAGLHCISCPASSFEAIGDGCLAHGMSEEQIDELLQKLNDEIKRIELEKKSKK